MSDSLSFLRLSRGFFEHFLWEEPRRYSRAEAWLDLLQHAAYAPHVRLVKGHAISLKRGSLVASVRWLSDRWLWSNTKVCQFLDLLRSEGMITTDKSDGVTVLSLCNFALYNFSSPPKNDAETNSARQPGDKKEEGEETPSGKERAKSQDELVSYCGTLGLPPGDGVYLWNSFEASGWLRGGHPIRDWQACIRAWQAGQHLPSQRKAATRRKPSPIAATYDPAGKIADQY